MRYRRRRSDQTVDAALAMLIALLLFVLAMQAGC